MSRPAPDFDLLLELKGQGFKRIVGVDEVGRGALAGPIVVAAVEMAVKIDGINDSKLVSTLKRQRLALAVKPAARQLCLGTADNAEIDELGTAAALRLAYQRALQNIEADLILTDNYPLSGYNYLRIQHGDRLFYPVAAASIVAKVYRDQMMCSYGRFFPQYGWERNVGYGTARHRLAIKNYGPSQLHRISFCQFIV